MINSAADFLKWLAVFGVDTGHGPGGGATQRQVQESAFNFAITTGSSNAYLISLSPPIPNYTDGLLVTFTANFTNTISTPTINVNGKGNVVVELWDSAAILPGDIASGATYVAVYNLADNKFRLINPSISIANTFLTQANEYNYAIDAGTTNAYVATLNPTPESTLTGAFPLFLDITNANTGASTIVLNGSSPIPIVALDGSALIGGELSSNFVAYLLYNSSESSFVLQNSLLGAGGGGSGNDFLPIGTIIDFAGTSEPTDYLACDGSAVSRATYSALFAAISTTWGVGDGTTTFNLPDLRRRVTMGSGGSGTAVIGNAVGDAGGEEAHAQTSSELAAHIHGFSGSSGTIFDPFNSKGISGGPGSNASWAQISLQVGNGEPTNALQVTSSGTTDSAGSGTAANIIQPSAITNKYIKFQQSASSGVTAQQIQENEFNSGTDTGVADAYVVTLNPSSAFTASNGTAISFSPLNANATTSPTLSVNGSTPLPIVLPNNTAVQAGDINTSSVAVYVIYSNGVWLLMNPLVSGGGVTSSQVQKSVFNTGTDSGVADAYVIACTPAITSYTDGLIIYFVPANSNTIASPTIDAGAGAIPVQLLNEATLLPSDIFSSVAAYFIYLDGSWSLLNPVKSYVSAYQSQNSAFTIGSDVGTTNAYVWQNTEASYAVNYTLPGSGGQLFQLTGVSNTNTGASTLAVSAGFNVLPIVTPNGSPLVGGEMVATNTYLFMYSNIISSYVLLNSSLSASSGDSYAEGISLLSIAIPTGGFTLRTTAPETTVNFSSLVTAVGAFNGAFPNATAIDFTHFANATSDFTPVLNSILSFSADSLVTVGGNFDSTITGSSSLHPSTISFAALTTVGGNFTGPGAQYYSGTPTIDFNSLTTITGAAIFIWGTNIGTISFPALTTIGAGINFGPGTGYEIDMAALTTVTGDFTAGTPTSMTTLNLPSIVNINGAISLSGLFSAVMPSLVTFSFGSGLLLLSGDFNLAGASLNLASVDGILASLAALDGTGGTTSYDNHTIDISGGSSATPDAAGLASIAILTGRGNTVNHN